MSESDPAARRARPSGREARQKARAQRPVAPAYITRELPPYEFLSPWLHPSGGSVCAPVAVPVNKGHFDMVSAHMRYWEKPFMGWVTTAARAADSIELCRILYGADFVASHCVILGNVNVNSPLVL